MKLTKTGKITVLRLSCTLKPDDFGQCKWGRARHICNYILFQGEEGKEDKEKFLKASAPRMARTKSNLINIKRNVKLKFRMFPLE